MISLIFQKKKAEEEGAEKGITHLKNFFSSSPFPEG